MTLFFLVVGLEAKREIDLGELREHNRLWYPALAALGGIAGAVGIYLIFNAGGPGGGGWGVAMSTDTALALGVLALAAPTGSTRLRVFLLTLAIFDDLAALVIIVIAYTGSIDTTALAIAVGLFAVLGLLRFLPTMRGPLAVLVGHRGLGGAVRVGDRPGDRRPRDRAGDERLPALARGARAGHRPDPRVPRAADRGRGDRAQRSLAETISANERIQFALHPWTSYVIVPLFALANAGDPHHRRPALGRGQLVDHDRHRRRLRGRQAARHLPRAVAGDAGAGAEDGRRRQADDHLAGAARHRHRGAASASPSPS